MSNNDSTVQAVSATTNAPTESELVERAKALVPKLAKRQEQALANRVISAETIQDFKDAEFFKVVQPAHWGGYDLPRTGLACVLEELAKGCPSSSWVLGVLSVHHPYMSGYSEQAQQDIWGDDPDTLICSSYMPSPCEDVEGGIKMSGSWGFSSGCDHAGWAIVGSMTPEKGMNAALVPMSDIEIVDDWYTLGMRGTGSKTLKLKDVFVPEHRLMPFMTLLSPRERSESYPESFWANHHLSLYGAYHFSCVVSGIARKALELAAGTMQKPNMFGVPRGRQETLQMRFSEAAADIEITADAMMDSCRRFDQMWEKRIDVSNDECTRQRRDIAAMVWRLRHGVEKLTTLHNAWIYDNSPMQGLFRDIVVASAHRAANLDDCMLPYAKSIL